MARSGSPDPGLGLAICSTPGDGEPLSEPLSASELPGKLCAPADSRAWKPTKPSLVVPLKLTTNVKYQVSTPDTAVRVGPETKVTFDELVKLNRLWIPGL